MKNPHIVSQQPSPCAKQDRSGSFGPMECFRPHGHQQIRLPTAQRQRRQWLRKKTEAIWRVRIIMVAAFYTRQRPVGKQKLDGELLGY